MRITWGLPLLACAVACLSDVGGMGSDLPPPNSEPAAGCSLGCHGDDNSNAPPMSISGVADTTATGVGAHQVHLNPSPSWHQKVECSDCHVVPQAVGDPGHIDGDNKAEVIFS